MLHLPYGQVAGSTQVVFQLTLLVTMLPAGHVTDRLGPIRVAKWSFAFLALYPIGLMLSQSALHLGLACVVYGVAMSGIHVAWTMGPVTLGRDASAAPHYMAIHATLVGVRALLGQFPAVWLYMVTGRIAVPLAVAMMLFLGGAAVMFRLERSRRSEDQPATTSLAPSLGDTKPA